MDVMLAIGFSGSFFILIFIFLVLSIMFILLCISRQPQNRYALAFLTPGLPFIPTIAITVNIYLIFKLSILTLVRFTLWMSLGLIMYFYYGITNSTLENPVEEIELTVDQSYITPQKVWLIDWNSLRWFYFALNFSPTNDDQKKEPFGKIDTVMKIRWQKKNGQRTEREIIGALITTTTRALTTKIPPLVTTRQRLT
jgi:hypothetical protein